MLRYRTTFLIIFIMAPVAVVIAGPIRLVWAATFTVTNTLDEAEPARSDRRSWMQMQVGLQPM